jgi:3-dehydroquinate synthase
MSSFNVQLKRVIDDSYEIEIGRNLFKKLAADIRNGIISNVSKIAILTDSVVKEIYGEQMLDELRQNNLRSELFVVQSGESNKTRESKAKIEDQMLEKGFGRDSCLIALGGGMVSDLGGFIASTFCRGIPYINYSTTLLSAADASVGGKTAVNTPVATNLIGNFYQPSKVYIDLSTWSSLPVREFRSGLAETIKHACMADREFFEYLEMNIDKVISNGELVLDPSDCEHIAFKNCEIKYRVVEKDERETNLRQILNLGHTAGRALEALSNYTLLHGEAVAVGISIQARLAQRLGFIDLEEERRINSLLERAGFIIKIPHSIEINSLVKKMYTDKKVRQGEIRFVFMNGIGSVKQFDDGSYSTPIKEEIIIDVLRELAQTSR